MVATGVRRGGPEIADGRRGRPWSLQLPDRVLLVAAYWRTNLTMRQIVELTEGRPTELSPSPGLVYGVLAVDETSVSVGNSDGRLASLPGTPVTW